MSKSKIKCKHYQTFWKFFANNGDEIGECGECNCLVVKKGDELLFLDLDYLEIKDQ